MDLYFDGRSYRRIAGNMDQFFGRETGSTGVYRWVRELTEATALALARERADNPPRQIKTDGLRSYRDAVPRAFPTRPVKPGVSQGIKSEINNNLSERLQGTIRDRDKTLRGLKARETGQAYVDGLALHYNYFRPHESLKGKRPAEAAGAELPFKDWADVAAMKSN